METAVGGEEQEACSPSGSERKEPRVGTVSRWHRAPEAPRQAGLAQPHLTSLSLERQGSCLLLSPQDTAEVRSWFTPGPEGAGCRHRVPQTGRLRQQNVTVSRFWRLEVQAQGVSRFGFS